jgi:4-hydroxyisophthalate hydroxylase
VSAHQVVIVGGGPVGVALAVDLGLRGLADDLRAARVMPQGYPIGEVTAYRSLMTEYWVAPPGREVVRSFYSQANERLPQYQMETVLRRKLVSLPGVTTCFGWTATKIEQDANAVRVSIAEENGSGRDHLEADYVVGCDGPRSLVREQIGIERGGEDFDQLMVLVVFRSRELHEGLKRFPERSTYRVMHPDLNGYWQFFGRIDVGEGFFFHAPVPANTTRENFDFHGLIQKVAGFNFACEFDHVGFWDLRVAVAKRYRVGRVFIAGDAAHSHPPYGGFGLNNGLEDACNLGWKLAARLKGWGGDTLLRSYGEERRPIFEQTADDYIAKRIKREGELLNRASPESDRTAFERMWQEFATDVGWRVGSYEPNYEGSPVVLGPANGVCSAHGEHVIKARAGHHLTPRPLSSGRDVFDELGPDFTLLAFDVPDESVASFEQAARSLDIPMKIVRDTYRDGREVYESRMILVRPDQYIVWIGDTAPANAADIMRRVAGRD